MHSLIQLLLLFAYYISTSLGDQRFPIVIIRWSGCAKHIQRSITTAVQQNYVIVIAEQQCLDTLFNTDSAKVMFEDINNYSKSANEFEKLFPKDEKLFMIRGNGRNYEFSCFARFYVLHDFWKLHPEIHTLAVFDDDTLFANISISKAFAMQSSGIRYPAPVYALHGDKFAASIWTDFRVLLDICEFFIKLYTQMRSEDLILNVLDNDMTAMACYAKTSSCPKSYYKSSPSSLSPKYTIGDVNMFWNSTWHFDGNFCVFPEMEELYPFQLQIAPADITVLAPCKHVPKLFITKGVPHTIVTNSMKAFIRNFNKNGSHFFVTNPKATYLLRYLTLQFQGKKKLMVEHYDRALRQSEFHGVICEYAMTCLASNLSLSLHDAATAGA